MAERAEALQMSAATTCPLPLPWGPKAAAMTCTGVPPEGADVASGDLPTVLPVGAEGCGEPPRCPSRGCRIRSDELVRVD